MRLSNRNNLQLQQLADGYREIGSKHVDPAIFEELIDRRENMTAGKLLEMSLAYEHAASVITSNCTPHDDDEIDGWYDLDDHNSDLAQEVLDDCVTYLGSRHLLIHHPKHPRWVSVRDEGAE